MFYLAFHLNLKNCKVFIHRKISKVCLLFSPPLIRRLIYLRLLLAEVHCFLRRLYPVVIQLGFHSRLELHLQPLLFPQLALLSHLKLQLSTAELIQFSAFPSQP